MTSQGGYIEQKTIGISIGTSGTFINTEIVDGKIQLVKKSVNPDIYATNGEWISSVVNIGDNFESYGKLLVKEVGNNNSSISVFTRTSSDGINFNEWTKISEENDILSVKNKFIMVKLELLAGFEADLMTVLPGENMVNGQYIVEDVSGNIKLNRNYTDDMTSDNTWSENGSLHRKLITRSDWLRLDKLNISPTVGQIDKTLILNQGEYKKWNDISPKSWELVSSTLPNQQQFTSDGMGNLSPLLDRKVTTLEPQKMVNKSDILPQGEVGKVFGKTLDLKKYMDIKNMKVEVK